MDLSCIVSDFDCCGIGEILSRLFLLGRRKSRSCPQIFICNCEVGTPHALLKAHKIADQGFKGRVQ